MFDDDSINNNENINNNDCFIYIAFSHIIHAQLCRTSTSANT